VCALAGGAPAFVTDNSSPPASTIPVGLLPVFEAAATASPCAVPWTLLAAVAATESGFDPTAVSGAGAQGLFQFEPATFAEYATPVPADGAHPPSPFDPVDAAYAAGRYLCSLGVVENPSLALVAYNCGNVGPGLPGRLCRLRREGTSHRRRLRRSRHSPGINDRSRCGLMSGPRRTDDNGEPVGRLPVDRTRPSDSMSRSDGQRTTEGRCDVPVQLQLFDEERPR
jgi:soluble lytic murein transglycosylase-like protein